MRFLEQGDLASAAVLQTITAWCVANGFLGDCGPSCPIIHKLPLCSSGVILHLSDDHRYSKRGYLAWSPRPRAIDSCLVLLPITNYQLPIVVCFSPSCLPMAMYAITALCSSTILSLTSLVNSLVLPMVVRLKV